MKHKNKIKYNYSYTLDLHGYILEDAIYELEKIMYSGKFRSILIVHGIGQGILKSGIRKYLASNSYIKKYFFGEDLNLPGRDGVTLIEI